MEITRSTKPFNKVDYYPLPNGKVDVFLHRNEVVETETDEEGNESAIYVADEVYFQTDKSVTKAQIEENFDVLWNEWQSEKVEITEVEKLRLEVAKSNTELFEMVLMMTGGGAV